MNLLLRLFLQLVVLAGLAAAAVWWIAARPLVLPAPVVDFTVQRGHNMRQAANAIAAAGVPSALLDRAPGRQGRAHQGRQL